MQIALRPEQEQFILEKLNQGYYDSADEIMAVAFQLLEEYEFKKRERELKQEMLEDIRQKVIEGMEDVRQGRVVDGEIVFQRIEAKLERIKRGEA